MRRLAAVVALAAWVAPAAAREGPAAFVLGLYGCFNQPRGCDPDFTRRPIDDALRELVARDTAAAGADIPLTSNGDEVGNCQECEPLSRLRIVRLTRTRHCARVTVRFNIAGYERRSEFRLVLRREGWKIADIIAASDPSKPGDSLVQSLQLDLARRAPR